MQKKSFVIKSPLEITIASLVQLAATIILSLLLSLLSSVILLSMEDPLTYSAFVSVFVILISCAVCSVISTKLIEAPTVCSLISGLLVAALLLLCSAFVQNSSSMSALPITVFYISIPAVSFLCSALPLRMMQKSRKHHIKHRKIYK